jgi:hypothetical protein
MFAGLKMVFSKTAPKMASKRIKTLFKIYTFTGPTFSRFFSDFAPYQGRPPEPFGIFRLLTSRNSSQYTYKQLAKSRAGISSKLDLFKFLIIGGIYLPARH